MEWFRDVYRRFFEHQSTFWLALGFLLVSMLSFEAGLLKQSLKEAEPIIIHTPDTVPAVAVPERVSSKVVMPATEAVATETTPNEGHCSFVGSKKSNKYHAPGSRCAKQIKPENQICFPSKEAAEAKGYLSGCLE